MQTLKDEASELSKEQRAQMDSTRAKANNDVMKKLEERTQQLTKDLEALQQRLKKEGADTAASRRSRRSTGEEGREGG